VPHERHVDPAILEFALDTVRGGRRVLDLGCGDGRVTGELSRAGVEVVGVDPSAVALERARSAHPGLEFVAPGADGSLPLGDSEFDVVVCLHVLEHVADTQTLLSEARRVLVPGGRMVISVPWHGTLKNVWIALRSFDRHHDPLAPVLRFYTESSLERLLEDFGFEQVTTRGIDGLPSARRTLLATAKRA
jgi:ubiquinone/menaquinone biosynthesis C-methylase UbiE